MAVVPSAAPSEPCFAPAGLYSRVELEYNPDEEEGTEHTDWTEAEIARLHVGLLAELKKLRHEKTPLDEIIDLLQWVSSDKDDAPFSFARCLAVAASYPQVLDEDFDLAGIDPEAAKEAVTKRGLATLRAKLRGLPEWVGQGLRSNWSEVVHKLDRDPQWLNKAIAAQRDVLALLASEDCPGWLRAYAQQHPEIESDPVHADWDRITTDVVMRQQAEGKLDEAIASPSLPSSVRAMLRSRREWAIERLLRQPRWLEEEASKRGRQLDLLASLEAA